MLQGKNSTTNNEVHTSVLFLIRKRKNRFSFSLTDLWGLARPFYTVHYMRRFAFSIKLCYQQQLLLLQLPTCSLAALRILGFNYQLIVGNPLRAMSVSNQVLLLL